MKKCLSLIIVFALVMMTATTAFATENNPSSQRIIVDGVDITIDIEEEIYRAKMGITDIDTPVAFSVSSNSDDVQLYTTTRKLGHLKNSDEEMYATTSVAVMPLANEKSDSDSHNLHYVTAYGTLYWRDNWGTDNDFLGASGGWDCDTNPETNKKPSLSGRRVKLSAITTARDGVDKTFNVSSNSFEFEESDFDYTRLTLTMRTYVTIDSTNKLQLLVQTSPFT